MHGRADRDIAVVELQIDLRGDRPNDAGNQLIGKSVVGLTVGLRRIAISSQHASGACAGAHGESEIRIQRNIIGDDTHDGADRHMPLRSGDWGAAERHRGGTDLVAGETVFNFETEARSPFVAGRSIEPRGIRKVDMAARETLPVLHVVDFGPPDAKSEIPTVSSGGSGCGKSNERRARKGNGTEFHWSIPIQNYAVPWTTHGKSSIAARSYCTQRAVVRALS